METPVATALPARRLPDAAADVLAALTPRRGVEPPPAGRVEPPPGGRPEYAAHPDSPVGRTNARFAAAAHRDVVAERGIRLSDWSDVELHELTAALLAEKHRRIARWLPVGDVRTA